MAWFPPEKRLGLGLQYPGSKEQIVPEILKEIWKIKPNATKFYDLFGGGGAVSFGASACGLETHYNELKSNVVEVLKYAHECSKNPKSHIGKLDKDCYRFCSRYEFFEIRDAFVKGEKLSLVPLLKNLLYSFNFLGLTYFCNSETEKLKHAGHNLIFHKLLELDYERDIRILCEFCGDTEFVSRILKEYCERPDLKDLNWIKRTEVFKRIIGKLCVICKFNLSEFKKCDLNQIYKFSLSDFKVKVQENIDIFKEITRLQHLDKILRFENLKPKNLIFTNQSYTDFNFENSNDKDTIIYCDIPYLRSSEPGGINEKTYHKSVFKHGDFINWVKEQNSHGVDIFISESDGFFEFAKNQNLNLVQLFSLTKQSNLTKQKSGTLMNEFLFLAPSKENK